MTTEKVAYLITYISFNCVYNTRGTIDENLLKNFLLDEVSEYIINNSCSTKFEIVDDVKKFWERYGGYNVWEAYCVKNNDWMNVKPTDEEILLNIYEMIKSTETFEEILEEMFEESLEDIILEKKINDKNKINYNQNNQIDEIDESNYNIINDKNDDSINFSISNDSFRESLNSDKSSNSEKSLIGEDIEIDWNTISIHEQEEINENWEE